MASKGKQDKDKTRPGNCPQHKDVPLAGLVYHGDKFRDPSEYRCLVTGCNYRRGRWSGKVLHGKQKEKKPKDAEAHTLMRTPGDTTRDNEPGFIPGVEDDQPDTGEPLDV